MKNSKRVAAIHDISGFGKCSLTVALPIISAAGIETSVIPTAVLSTHTGGFSDFTYRDLTSDILPIAKHWKSLSLQFDGIYSGYLGSIEQVEILIKVIEMLKNKDTLVLVDPVMADDGKLYPNFDKSFPKEIKKVCKTADIIVPNITEACLLTEMPYKKGPYTKDYIETIICKLKLVCKGKIVLTDVHFDETKLGCAVFDGKTTKYCFTDKIEGFYHGTGDVFGSVLLAGLMNEKSLFKSAEIAVEITSDAIKATKQAKTDVRFGVDFEHQIPKMIELLNL